MCFPRSQGVMWRQDTKLARILPARRPEVEKFIEIVAGKVVPKNPTISRKQWIRQKARYSARRLGNTGTIRNRFWLNLYWYPSVPTPHHTFLLWHLPLTIRRTDFVPLPSLPCPVVHFAWASHPPFRFLLTPPAQLANCTDNKAAEQSGWPLWLGTGTALTGFLLSKVSILKQMTRRSLLLVSPRSQRHLPQPRRQPSIRRQGSVLEALEK